jgi:hypothetical protein
VSLGRLLASTAGDLRGALAQLGDEALHALPPKLKGVIALNG